MYSVAASLGSRRKGASSVTLGPGLGPVTRSPRTRSPRNQCGKNAHRTGLLPTQQESPAPPVFDDLCFMGHLNLSKTSRLRIQPRDSPSVVMKAGRGCSLPMDPTETHKWVPSHPSHRPGPSNGPDPRGPQGSTRKGPRASPFLPGHHLTRALRRASPHTQHTLALFSGPAGGLQVPGVGPQWEPSPFLCLQS